jgi:TonB family protein
VTIDSFIQKNKDSNLSFYLLAVGAMILLSCSTNDSQQRNNATDSLALALNGQYGDLKENGKYENAICKIDSLLPEDFVVMGDLVANDSLIIDDPNGVRILAGVMPEFIGGFEKLAAYIKENLKYPEWENNAGIQGNVFVSFTVDKEGRIIDPKILKSVEGSRNFDNEVIRLINSMPKWKPGQEHGENVAVQFVLPIKFNL